MSALPDGYDEEMQIETLALVSTRVIPHAGTTDASAAARALLDAGEHYIEIADGDDLFTEWQPQPDSDA